MKTTKADLEVYFLILLGMFMVFLTGCQIQEDIQPTTIEAIDRQPGCDWLRLEYQIVDGEIRVWIFRDLESHYLKYDYIDNNGHVYDMGATNGICAASMVGGSMFECGGTFRVIADGGECIKYLTLCNTDV